MGTKEQQKVSPDTVEVIRNQLLNIAEEMQATVMNSAYSSLWQEAGDLSCAVLSPGTEIVGQSERVIPVHIATMINTAEESVKQTGGYENLHAEDILMQNDPYSGNNHLPDFLIMRPVIIEDTLIGFTGVRGHWVDVGGSAPSSYAIDTKEIIKEGIRVPPSKLYREGVRNDDLLEVILSNVRDREERMGDLNAQLAGVNHGHERLKEIVRKHGVSTVLNSMDQILSNEEESIRNKVKNLPDGNYKAVDYMDGPGTDDSLLEIHADVEIRGTDIIVDFEGTDDQSERGINASKSVTEATTSYAIKVCLDPGEPGTSGAYRPIDVSAPKGSLLNPRYPGPVVTGNHEAGARVFDTVVKAISQIDSSLVFGAGEGSSNVFNYQALESKKINYTVMGGGMGACPTRDGINAIRSGVGNSGVQPVERVEQDYDSVTIEELSIVPNTCGSGRYRGGNTARRTVRFEEDTEILLACERAKSRPYGINGGKPGQSSKQIHITPDGEKIVLPSKTTKQISSGSKIVLQPAGGGGYGDPQERPVDEILDDVRNGYITIEKAKEDYKVVIDPESLEVNTQKTEDLRSDNGESN